MIIDAYLGMSFNGHETDRNSSQVKYKYKKRILLRTIKKCYFSPSLEL
jgi:hypothetical protein